MVQDGRILISQITSFLSNSYHQLANSQSNLRLPKNQLKSQLQSHIQNQLQNQLQNQYLQREANPIEFIFQKANIFTERRTNKLDQNLIQRSLPKKDHGRLSKKHQ